MSIICPNFNNKEVKQQFDELAAATSEQAAYHIWSQNEGLPIDYTPASREVVVDIDQNIEDVSNMILNKLMIKKSPFRSKKIESNYMSQSDTSFVVDRMHAVYYGITGLMLSEDRSTVEETIETVKFNLHNNLKEHIQENRDRLAEKLDSIEPLFPYAITEGITMFLKRRDSSVLSEYSPRLQEIIRQVFPYLFGDSKFKSDKQKFAFALNSLKNPKSAASKKLEAIFVIDNRMVLSARALLKKADTLLTFLTMVHDATYRIEKKVLSEMRRAIEFKNSLDKKYRDSIKEKRERKPLTEIHDAATSLTDDIRYHILEDQSEKINALFPGQSIYVEDSDAIVAQSDSSTLLSAIIGFDNEYSDLAKLLLGYTKKNNLRVNLIVSSTDAPAGTVHYKFKNETDESGNQKSTEVTSAIINVLVDSLNFKKTPDRLVLHEIVHSLTVLRVASDPKLTESLDKYLAYCKNYVKKNSAVSQMFGFDSVYGFSNSHEFIAEYFSNFHFQELLKAIPPMENTEFSNLFEEILDRILNWLGLSNKNAYEQIRPIMLELLNLQEEALDDMPGLRQFSVEQPSYGNYDKAPNGAPSKLFADLLEHFNGDRVLAIQAKAKVFSTGFKMPQNDAELDENGEPTIGYVLSGSNKVHPAQAAPQIIPLSESSEQLYKHYNLLNEKGEVKTVPYAKKSDIDAIDKWVATLNMNNSNYLFKVRLTPSGHKIFIYDAVPTLFGSNSTESEILSKVEESTPSEIKPSSNPMPVMSPNITNSNKVFEELTASGDKVLAELAGAVKQMIDSVSADPIEIEYVDFPLNEMFTGSNVSKNTPALYSPKQNKIYVSTSVSLVGHPYSKNPEYAAQRILLHEIVHAYTVKSVANDSAAAKKLNELFVAYKAKHTDYASQSIEEFIAELFSNPNVMNNMETIESGDMNLLQRLYNWFKSLFTSKSGINSEAVQAVLDLITEYNADRTLVENDGQIPLPFAASSVRDELAMEKLTSTFNEIKESIVNKINTLRYSKYDKPFAAKKEKEQSGLLYSLKTISDNLTGDYQQDMLYQLEGLTEYIDNVANSVVDMKRLLVGDSTVDSIDQKMARAIADNDTDAMQMIEAILDDFYRNTLKPSMANLNRIYDTLTQEHNRNIYLSVVGTDQYQILLDISHSLLEQLSPERMASQDNIGYIYKNIAIRKTQNYLYNKGTDASDPGIIRALKNWLEIDSDISFFERWVGSATSSKSFILRLIAKQINDVDNYVNRQAHAKFAELRKAALATSKHMKLFELDENGKKTGFLVRDRKYGLYYRDRSAFRDKWLKDNNILSFNDLKLDKKLYKLYLKDSNEWIDKRANRRYIKEYYDLFSDLSIDATEALDEVNNLIDSITFSYRNKDTRRIQFEDMPNDVYEEYLYAVQRKRNLSNPYNYDTGEKKTGIEADIAAEISKLNEKIMGGIKAKPNMTAFLDEMDRVRAESVSVPYGKSKYDLWLERNTKIDYTEDFKNYLANRAKKDYGVLYANLQDALNDILKLYKNHNNEVDYTMMPEKAKDTVRRLDIAMAKIAASSKGGVKVQKAFNVMLTDIANANGGKLALTPGVDTFHDGYRVRYHSYLTKIQPVNPDVNLTRVPNSNWNETTSESKYWNSEYDATVKDREQPKTNISRYNNEKAFAILDPNSSKFDADLRNFYDTIIDMMNDANSNKLHFQEHANNYKLPQKTGGLHNYIAGAGIVSGFGKWVKDSTRILSQDEGFGGDKMTTADGRAILLPPTHYMAMLDDTSVGSNDLTNLVMSYYKMALNYEAKEKISHQLNLVNDLVKDYAEYNTGAGRVKSPDSNLSNKIDQLIKMFVYGEKTSKSEVDLLGIKFSASKLIDLFTKWGRDCGLAWNPRSALSGGLSAATFYVSEAKAGNIYNSSNFTYGTGVAMKEYATMRTLSETGKNISTNSFLFGMMERNGVSFDQGEEFKNVNRMRIGRILGRMGGKYNFFKLASVLPNSFAMPSIYDNYRLVTKSDGTHAFMSENDFVNFEEIPGIVVDENNSISDVRKEKKAIFNTFHENLWNAYTQDKDGTIRVKPEYEPYVTEKIENEVNSKILWIASHAEGMASGVDRTGLFYHPAAAVIFLFRYFIIKNIENAFAGLHWNYEIKSMMMGTLTSVFQGYLYGTNQSFYKKIYNVADALRVGKSKEEIEKARAEAVAKLHDTFGDIDIKTEIARYQNRFNGQMAGFIFWTFLINVILNAMFGLDDEKDDYFINMGMYMVKRVELETGSRYKVDDIASIFNSVSPLTKHLSNLMHVVNVAESSDYKKIKKGAYKGLYGWQRDLIRVTPLLNSYYNMTNPKEKLDNLQNTLNR